jgi:hypothetical protein
MKSRYLASAILLCALVLGFVSDAGAQGVTRVCVENVNSTTGANNCVEASTTNPFPVTGAAVASGGASSAQEIAPNNTTGVSVKGTPGTIYGVQLGGIGSAPAYLKIYDSAAAPTCGSGTPIKRLIIPAAATAANGAANNITFGPTGITTANGIGYCVTTGITDADTTAPAASTFLVNIDFK